MAEKDKKKKTPVPELFIWKGVDNRQKKISGELYALNINAARAELNRKNIVPIKVRKKPKDLFPTRPKPIKPVDIAVFTRMLATMVSSGVPLMQSLDIISQGQENPSMGTLILDIKNDVESGETLSNAMGKFPLYFDDLFVNLVNAGEQSGTLESLLNEIANYKEKTEALKAKIKKALIYPTAIIVVAFVVTAILMIFVIPQFQTLFDGFGAELPGLTLMVIGISKIFQAYWWLIFGGIGGAIYGILQAKKRSRKVQHFMDRLALKIPVVGGIVEKGAIARFTRTFATMFKAGVPITDAMKSVAGATGNILFEEKTHEMNTAVTSGTQLNVAMKDSELFPVMVTQMVSIGEESGSLDAMLGRVADIFEGEVDSAVDNMTALLEPLIMAFLGVIIGTLVIAMYLPIFKLGQVV